MDLLRKFRRDYLNGVAIFFQLGVPLFELRMFYNLYNYTFLTSIDIHGGVIYCLERLLLQFSRMTLMILEIIIEFLGILYVTIF